MGNLITWMFYWVVTSSVPHQPIAIIQKKLNRQLFEEERLLASHPAGQTPDTGSYVGTFVYLFTTPMNYGTV